MPGTRSGVARMNKCIEVVHAPILHILLSIILKNIPLFDRYAEFVTYLRGYYISLSWNASHYLGMPWILLGDGIVTNLNPTIYLHSIQSTELSMLP